MLHKNQIKKIVADVKALIRGPEETTGVYLSSRVREETMRMNIRMGELFVEHSGFAIFLPHTISPQEHHEEIEEAIYRRCVEEIDRSKVLLLLADAYGRDCAWEVGYARGKGKFVVAVVETSDGLQRIREDWMVKGAIDATLVVGQDLYQTALEDTMLRNKPLLHVEYQNIPKTLSLIARN